MSSPPQVHVGALLRGRAEALGLALDLLSGAGGLGRSITSPHVQKTGLALAGFHQYLKPGRVLIFGESEVRFLESLAATTRSEALRLAFMFDLPCVIVTNGLPPPRELIEESEQAQIPLLS